jgi:hypothetical protein
MPSRAMISFIWVPSVLISCCKLSERLLSARLAHEGGKDMICPEIYVLGSRTTIAGTALSHRLAHSVHDGQRRSSSKRPYCHKTE